MEHIEEPNSHNMTYVCSKFIVVEGRQTSRPANVAKLVQELTEEFSSQKEADSNLFQDFKLTAQYTEGNWGADVVTSQIRYQIEGLNEEGIDYFRIVSCQEGVPRDKIGKERTFNIEFYSNN